jgi:hypothetical protein
MPSDQDSTYGCLMFGSKVAYAVPLKVWKDSGMLAWNGDG